MATVAGVTYQLQKRKCGKKDCKKCPHGPYWYAFWRDGIGRQHSKYVGKELPAQIRNIAQEQKLPTSLTWEEMDWLTLGLMKGTSFTKARSTYRQIVVALKIQRKANFDAESCELIDKEIAAVCLAFRRLFPGRR